MIADLPLLIEPEDLQNLLEEESLVVLDLCKETTYSQLHIPGAVHLSYGLVVTGNHPVNGLLPEPRHLEQVFSAHGIGNQTHVVAYDDEGGGNASRLLWTLEAMGHRHYSLLNGGLHAWTNEGHPCSREKATPAAATFSAIPTTQPVASTEYILQQLNNSDFTLWDARSSSEFSGMSRFSQHPGHIPGAINLDWLAVMDRQRNLRLKPNDQLNEQLSSLGLSKEKEIITYCQTHHRSSLTWFVLHYLGYPRCKGYPGSWSDWGNRDDTPKAMS
ncbi:MAG: sulfurtransferase [Candidatus Thiodiazotropha sp. (ex Lucinoma borealis)]|nr:sulfurtransferase [Candidatus Thiodiazotropha sp. (ex Lucinoma borealis)]